MSAQTEPIAQLTDLERSIRQNVLNRTGQRIHALHVAVVNDCVVIQGRTATYYVKQLALQGVFDALGPRWPTRIDLKIQVGNAGTMQDD